MNDRGRRGNRVFLLLIWIGLAIGPPPSRADDYNHVARDVFWQNLYPDGGWTLYCGLRFDGRGGSSDGYAIGIDHIYAREWMLDFLHCESRRQCRAGSPVFGEMEADLHNLYPAWSDLGRYRAGRHFGELEGGESRLDNCDLRWKGGIFEPRALSRGNIARAIFYMHDRYRAPVPFGMLETLKAWNRADPPSEQERIRNDRIEQLQGRRNPYIDDPALAEALGDSSPAGLVSGGPDPAP